MVIVMVEISRLRELFEYRDGDLYWKVKKTSRVNKGDLAGNIDLSCNKPYKRISVDSIRFKYHTIVFALCIGRYPLGVIDHIDGNGLNNNISNLRDVSLSENLKNKKLYDSNTSGMSGVTFHKTIGKWYSRISVAKQRISLGYFNDLEDAIKVRKLANIKYGFHKNHGMIRNL